jgi:hypothetical protein
LVINKDEILCGDHILTEKSKNKVNAEFKPVTPTNFNTNFPQKSSYGQTTAKSKSKYTLSDSDESPSRSKK